MAWRQNLMGTTYSPTAIGSGMIGGGRIMKCRQYTKWFKCAKRKGAITPSNRPFAMFNASALTPPPALGGVVSIPLPPTQILVPRYFCQGNMRSRRNKRSWTTLARYGRNLLSPSACSPSSGQGRPKTMLIALCSTSSVNPMQLTRGTINGQTPTQNDVGGRLKIVQGNLPLNPQALNQVYRVITVYPDAQSPLSTGSASQPWASTSTPCGLQPPPPPPIPVGRKVQLQFCPTPAHPHPLHPMYLNPTPWATIDGQTPTGADVGRTVKYPMQNVQSMYKYKIVSLLPYIIGGNVPTTTPLNSTSPCPAQGGQVYGCTQPIALNYNPLATVDDGSCIFQPPPPNIILGCTNPQATNYNPLATADNGSCIFPPSPPPTSGGGGFGRGLSQSNMRARYGKAFGG